MQILQEQKSALSRTSRLFFNSLLVGALRASVRRQGYRTIQQVGT